MPNTPIPAGLRNFYDKYDEPEAYDALLEVLHMCDTRGSKGYSDHPRRPLRATYEQSPVHFAWLLTVFNFGFLDYGANVLGSWLTPLGEATLVFLEAEGSNWVEKVYEVPGWYQSLYGPRDYT
jgi:hypothetical protein